MISNCSEIIIREQENQKNSLVITVDKISKHGLLLLCFYALTRKREEGRY